MAAKTTGAPNAIPDEFEPFCHWEKEEGHEALVVHLPEFKKEQLRVQINNQGVLIITGERQVNPNKRSGFRKEIKVPADCNSNEIHAKFTNGLLSIIMPKTITQKDNHDERKQEEKESEKPRVTDDQTGNNAEKKEETPSPENAASSAALLSAEKPPVRQGIRLHRPPLMHNLSKKAKTVNAGVAVAVVVAIGAYVAYKYCYSLSEN